MGEKYKRYSTSLVLKQTQSTMRYICHSGRQKLKKLRKVCVASKHPSEPRNVLAPGPRGYPSTAPRFGKPGAPLCFLEGACGSTHCPSRGGRSNKRWQSHPSSLSTGWSGSTPSDTEVVHRVLLSWEEQVMEQHIRIMWSHLYKTCRAVRTRVHTRSGAWKDGHPNAHAGHVQEISGNFYFIPS